MKNALRTACIIVVMALSLGCPANQKAEENAFVPVTGQDLAQLSKRIASMEARMQAMQKQLAQAEEERSDQRARLQAIEARLMITATAASPSVSHAAPMQPATATTHRGNNEKR